MNFLLTDYIELIDEVIDLSKQNFTDEEMITHFFESFKEGNINSQKLEIYINIINVKKR